MTQTTPPPGATSDPDQGQGGPDAGPGGPDAGRPGQGWNAGGEGTGGQFSGSGRTPDSGSDWAEGGTVFAGVLMLVYGLLGIVQGIAGIADDDVYTRVGDYVFEFDVTTWGWIHLAVGVVLALVGWGILQGAAWARVVGIALASVAVIINFMWLPYVPFWGLINIAIGVFIIWALAKQDARTSS